MLLFLGMEGRTTARGRRRLGGSASWGMVNIGCDTDDIGDVFTCSEDGGAGVLKENDSRGVLEALERVPAAWAVDAG